ncbi:unnamed protein product [Clonostachys rhizophaga]|uniref:DUF6594 domain-containing protein n=1 Tax=Clonostachys rhizophaga TaxID=160324 RepID=A0A9N9VRU4_9HYPO|nr:unnamed protein product [Clonostachys rhizophaga]
MSSPVADVDLEMSPHPSRRTTGSIEAPRSQNADSLHVPRTNEDESQPTKTEILDKPWKYVGYDGYSKFIASDSDFFILRRFSTLNVRIALALQDDISSLEEELAALDKKYSMKSHVDVHNGSLRHDQRDRKAVVEKITKLRDSEKNSSLHWPNNSTDEFVLQQAKLHQLDPAPKRDIKNLHNWHHNHDKDAIFEEEWKYLAHDDLICPVTRDKTPLRRLLDKSHWLRTLTIWRNKDVKAPEYDAEHISYYSNKRMDRFTSAILLIIGIVMLITPIWILEALNGIRHKLAVITVYVFVFLLILSLAMYTKPFEALGATAA